MYESVRNKRASYVSAWGVGLKEEEDEEEEEEEEGGGGGGTGGEMFACPVCEKVFLHESTLSSHLKVHTGETRCTVCGKVLSRRADLRRHARSVHGVLIV